MSFYWNELSKRNKISIHAQSFKRLGLLSIEGIEEPFYKKIIYTLQVQGQTRKKHSNKRIYFSTLKDERGSMTVEMAVAFPLFLFAIGTFILFGQMIVVDQEIQRSMVESARQIAVEEYPEKTVLLAKSYWKKEVNQKEVEHSCVKNGVKGVSFFGSHYDEKSGEVVLKAQYVLQNKLPFFQFLSYKTGHEIRQKVFRGYQPELEGEEAVWVYVTETQSVYHRSRNCTYLQLKIHQVASVKDYLDGKTSYTPCEICMKKNKNPTILYITEQGRKYHQTLRCSGLKRTVYRVRESEVGNLSECSRCRKKKP